jgi:hypothetical protein
MHVRASLLSCWCAHAHRYNEFVFVVAGDNKPAGAGGGAAAAADRLGTIEVTVSRCEKTRCVGLPACDRCAAKRKPGVGKAGKATANLPAAGANKKFFELPSLGSKAGAASTVGYAAKTHHYTKVSA